LEIKLELCNCFSEALGVLPFLGVSVLIIEDEYFGGFAGTSIV
jgi:hypothetical protein